MDWIAVIDEITKTFKEKFGNLDEEELNWKPYPQTWSIAQNIDHLIVVNKTYFPVMASLQEGSYKAPLIAKIGFVVSFIGKTILHAVNPYNREKIKTFPVWEPTISQIKGDILLLFENHQRELKHRIESSEEFIEKGVIISSPANRNIVYKLETAFDIIVTHEQRHLRQASEILDKMK